MRVQNRIGEAVALALLCVSISACDNPLAGNPKQIDASALGAKADARIRAFYEARGWASAWDGKSQKALLAVLDEAANHGLRRDLFLKGDLPEDGAEREVALTSAAIRYASALAQGYADPKKLGRIYTVPRAKADVSTGLAKALDDGDLKAWFDSLAPQTEEYRALSAAFLRYAKLNDVQGSIPEGGVIKPGQNDRRVPALAKALVANGYLDGEPADSQAYAPALVTAVKMLQAEYGIEADGIVGSGTIAILNRGPGDRARQLAVNLERLRWLEREAPKTRIDVNTAASYLEYYRDGALRDRRRVVNGQPDWETPELGSPLFQLVAHPFWRVPDSIYKDELAAKGPAYFAAQGMEFRDGRLVQLPGPKNSLGAVKFDLKNDQAIYLHDTPAKAVFALDERHRSHGCIRVNDAVGFAMMVAQDEGVADKFRQAMMKAEDEGFVKLGKEIPVRLMYRTAFLDNGKVRLADDVYQWDPAIAYELGYVRQPPRARKKVENGDVGP